MQSFWEKKGLKNIVLLPLSVIFFFITYTRKFLYKKNIFRSYISDIPIVCVGNIVAGGAGKTPLVIGISEALLKKNVKIAIISKGYGGTYRKFSKVHIVCEDDSAYYVGDEALLVKKRLGCPVVVADNRVIAAKVVKELFSDTDIIICDDGLQHYALEKDISIAVISNNYRFGNGYLLPAGPLRERKSTLKGFDFVVENLGSDNKRENINTKSNLNYKLNPSCWVNVKSYKNKLPIDYFSSNKYSKDNTLSFSGIAHPKQFFSFLEKNNINTSFKEFPDHYSFKEADLPKKKTLLMTEKDAVKVSEIDGIDGWYLHCDTVMSNDFLYEFLRSINKLMSKKI